MDECALLSKCPSYYKCKTHKRKSSHFPKIILYTLVSTIYSALLSPPIRTVSGVVVGVFDFFLKIAGLKLVRADSSQCKFIIFFYLFYMMDHIVKRIIKTILSSFEPTLLSVNLLFSFIYST